MQPNTAGRPRHQPRRGRDADRTPSPLLERGRSRHPCHAAASERRHRGHRRPLARPRTGARAMTSITRAAVAGAFARVTAEALSLPEGEVPAPNGDRLVAIMNDWLATRNWRFAYVRDPQTFAWPGSWIALASDQRSPSGWRPVLMFGDPSGPLHDPLGSGRGLR